MQVAKDSDKISEDKKTNVIKYFQELADHDVQRSIIEQQNQKSEGDSRIIGIEDPVEFYQLLVKGSFKSYDNRTYLAGPCNVGKTTLASVLIGEHIPETWESTNGLVMYFGRNGIDLKTCKMIPLPKGQIDHVYSKVLQGMPKLRTNRRESSSSDMNWNDIEEDAKSVMHPRDQNRQLDTTQGPLHGAVTELRPEIPFSEGIFYPRAILPSQIRDDILERIRSGSYLMQIAPSDLVDFGGQKSFDMTHQLFIQHNGTIVLMFNGSKSMHEPLSEHSEDNVTTFCK